MGEASAAQEGEEEVRWWCTLEVVVVGLIDILKREKNQKKYT